MTSNYRQPLPSYLQNALILLSSGLIASVLCAKAFGATLPEPTNVSATTETTTTVQAQAPAPATNNDAAAAAQLRAMLMGRTALVGAPAPAEPRQ